MTVIHTDCLSRWILFYRFLKLLRVLKVFFFFFLNNLPCENNLPCDLKFLTEIDSTLAIRKKNNFQKPS